MQAICRALMKGGSDCGCEILFHQSETEARERQVGGRAQNAGTNDFKNIVDQDVLAALQALDEVGEKVLTVALVQGQQQFLLAREIEIDSAFRYPRCTRHFCYTGQAARVAD